MRRARPWHRSGLLAALLLTSAPLLAGGPPPAPKLGPCPSPPARLADLDRLIEREDYTGIHCLGTAGLDELAARYRRGDSAQKVRIAGILYRLSEKSPAATAALLADAHTADPVLRVSVQYALGRVSDDREVVLTLLEIMRTDPSAHFRDKAACALAYDQPHLDERQKVVLFAGLIGALGDENDQVRAIAILALQIHTGQTKGYRSDAPPVERREAITRWHQWLMEYRANL